MQKIAKLLKGHVAYLICIDTISTKTSIQQSAKAFILD